MPNSSERFNRIRGITELIANLALIVAVIVGVTAWLRRSYIADHVKNTNIAAAAGRSPAVGTKLALPGVNWSAHKATLVVAISSACHYCVASAPFYGTLTRSSHAASILVVMPQEKDDVQAFLQQHAITPNNTVSADLANINVSATPTLLLVSSSGIVTKAWVGELSDVDQLDVTRSLDRI